MKSLYLEEWDTFIRYHEIPGESEPLVYLPGLSMPAVAQFLSVVTHKEMGGYHTLLIDYIGSGYSDHSDRFDYSIESHSRAIAAVLEKEGVKGSTVVGHSMGGAVGIRLAISQPELVAKLIVAEANLDPGGGAVTQRIASYSETVFVKRTHRLFLKGMRSAERAGDESATFIHAAWGKADPAGLYRSAVALVELDEKLRKQFENLSIPRTFIYGEETLPKEPNEARPDAPDPDELKKFDIQISIVPHAGHIMMFDNLDGFVNVLKEALEGASGQTVRK
jgi:pimeloyl-ACP methyl ester carboxylesterase